MPSLAQATVGIITALPKEEQAMLQVFRCRDAVPVFAPGDGAGHKYYLVEVPTRNGGSVLVAMGTLLTPGNNSAAIRATQMRHDCPNVRHVIVAGIAGAVPNLLKAEDHVRLGDIVISNETGTIQFDLQKETNEEITIRGQPKPSSFKLLEAARGVRIGRTHGPHPWEAEITEVCRALGEGWGRPDIREDRCEDTVIEDGGAPTATNHPVDDERTPGQPRVFFGPIGSSNTLLKSSAKRDYLRDNYQVKAIEMEASGVAAAAGQEESHYLVVRGTCDYCNHAKDDKWQKYAAVIAAVFTRHIFAELNGLPAPSSPPPPTAPAPATVNIHVGANGIVQHITGGQIGAINVQTSASSPALSAEDFQRFTSVLGRVEEHLAGNAAPSEQDREDYRQRARDDMARMKRARQAYEYDEVAVLVTKVEPWLRDHKAHLPPDLFDAAWWELISGEKFRQDVRRSRGEKWDSTAIHRMMKELGYA